MSVQGFSNGGQVRDIFQAYNDKTGFEALDMSLNYNTGDKYSNKISDGNQIDLALQIINVRESEGGINFSLHQDWSNGIKLKNTMKILETFINNMP